MVEERSSLNSADHIVIPLMIAKGANDPRVKQAESEPIVDALKEKGKDVVYLLYEDEGHGLLKQENRLHFYTEMEELLAKHLGGRVEK